MLTVLHFKLEWSEVLINIYRLINAYVGIPGSIVNQISMGGDQPFDKAAYLNHRVAATERRTEKYEAATPLNCPDAHVLGRTVRELFPYFTQRSFNAGMAVTNVVTGEKPPMTTVKLNGRWWKVYAMDKKTQQEHEVFTPIPGGNSYWPTSIRQVVAAYAFRFNQSANMTNSLLGDNGQGYYDPTLMRNIQPKQSVVAKKCTAQSHHLTMESSGNVIRHLMTVKAISVHTHHHPTWGRRDKGCSIIMVISSETTTHSPLNQRQIPLPKNSMHAKMDL